MEVKFQKKALDCLRSVVWESKSEEQTLEVKLPDAMPDIGRVLGAWGQPLIRSKEWRGDGMSVAGGVMVWVLYAPEDASMPRTVETWVPFQMRWEFPKTQRDGTITVSCLLRSVDARLVNARKLMTRVVVDMAGEALEPSQLEVYEPGKLPDDVCILRRNYPLVIPRESGEKTFSLDEELSLPATCMDVQKLVHYSLQPELIDKKVMGDKVVFRGTALVHALCRCGDGVFKTCDFDIPFSQYAELSKEYDSYATATVVPMVTNLELDLQDSGSLRLKAGMAGQYVVSDRPVVEAIEDAYSPKRNVSLQREDLEIPSILEQKQELIKAEQTLQIDGEIPLDMAFFMGQPTLLRGERGVSVDIPGNFQMISLDEQGNLHGNTVRWTETMEIPADGRCRILATARPSGRPQGMLTAGNGSIRCDVLMETTARCSTAIPQITGLELGELLPADPDRPSLILRRVENDSLWDMAKACGSTVEAIMVANGLAEAPEQGKILLIPVS